MFAYAWPALAGFLALCGLVWAEPAAASRLSMEVSGWTSAPVGYIDFCRIHSDQCLPRGGDAARPFDEASWRDLQEVNTFVNSMVIPATDLDHYRREEIWALPQSHGDCEDFVLLKRKWLIERGWPTGALLITVVFDEIGDGHAVLLARTNRGDLVLDNKTDSIRLWHETAYRFVKRQSVADPKRWVSVGDPRWTTRNTAAPR
jgi:predicted transglutaminase-like cysteine proteinase